MAKGRANPALRIVVAEQWLQHEKIRELEAQGHHISMYGTAYPQPDAPDLILHPAHVRQHLAYLFSRDTRDVYGEDGDRLPAVYQAISWGYTLVYRLYHPRPARAGTALMEAVFDGIEWNGEPIP